MHLQMCINAFIMTRMTPQYFISHVETLAAEAGLTIDELCKEAKVARSTFTRWKNGDSKPTFSTISKFEKAATKKKGTRQ
jgi:predicted transcriptional regulator